MIYSGFAQEGLDAPPGILEPKGPNRGKGPAMPGPSSLRSYSSLRCDAPTHRRARFQNKSVPCAERALDQSLPLANMQAEFHPPESPEPKWSQKSARKFRYQLKEMAGRILAGTTCKRVSKCGHKLIGPQATICIGKAGAYIAGVETCGSVWNCAVCAAKISEGRRKEVAQALDAHVSGGGDVFMCLFTIPHHAMESCEALKATVAKAWKAVIQGKAWQTACKRYGIKGYIRALEMTHGKNGWHPHIHALLLTRGLNMEDEAGLRQWLGERWAKIVARISDKAVNLAGAYGFQRACSVSAAGEYVAKWGVDSEIAKASSKISTKGGRSPWQLLADAINGDHCARMAFREYAFAMKGARHLTWSKGLRDLYVTAPELSDLELAKADAPNNGDQVVGVLRRFHWFEVYSRSLVPDLLSAAEANGWPGVLEFLRNHRLALSSPQQTYPYGPVT